LSDEGNSNHENDGGDGGDGLIVDQTSLDLNSVDPNDDGEQETKNEVAPPVVTACVACRVFVSTRRVVEALSRTFSRDAKSVPNETATYVPSTWCMSSINVCASRRQDCPRNCVHATSERARQRVTELLPKR